MMHYRHPSPYRPRPDPGFDRGLLIGVAGAALLWVGLVWVVTWLWMIVW